MARLPDLVQQRERTAAAEAVVETVIFERQIKPRVTAAIVQEHAARPIGHHSDDLERVLLYLRSHHLTMKDKYILVCTKPHEEWRIAMLTGRRNEPPVLTEEAFGDRDAAEHGVFLRRLRDAGLWGVEK